MNLSPMPRNLHMCPCSTINNKVSAKQLEIKPNWASNPQHGVTTVTVEARRTLFPSIPHVPRMEQLTCLPYPAMQVSNSWHTQDGFFLHKRKGAVK